MKSSLAIIVLSILLVYNTWTAKKATHMIFSERNMKAISTGLSTTDTTLNGEWFLQVVLPSDRTTGKTLTLVFNLSKGTFTGNTGCNTMSGSFKTRGGSLVFNDK